jgi:hypothetical protein
MSMWAGILAGLCLAFATAVSYSEVNKLYPGAGSSYLFAEQAFLNHSRHFRFARMAKFVLGLGSHLYYWVYPGPWRHHRDHDWLHRLHLLPERYQFRHSRSGLHGADSNYRGFRDRLHRVQRSPGLDG